MPLEPKFRQLLDQSPGMAKARTLGVDAMRAMVRGYADAFP